MKISKDKVISQIDQKTDVPWPLTVIDFENKKDKLYLEPGDMVLYESAKLPHGRQFPFQGEYYDNLFVHFYLHDKTFEKIQ